MSDAFERYQAGVRASDRMHCEADIYWRTNRWAMDGRGYSPSFKPGPIEVISHGENVGRSPVAESFAKAKAADRLIYRR